MVSITLSVDTEAFLERVTAIDRDYEEEDIIQGAAELALSRVLSRFRKEVDPDGRPWVPSAAAIREHRPTLQDTLRLYRSIRIYPGDDSESRNIETRGVPYAVKHQNGIGVIQRRFMGFDQAGEDERAIVEYIEGRVNQILVRYGD